MQSKGLVSAKINGFLALREHKAFSLESVAQTQEKRREFDPTNEFYVTCPNQCQPAPFESAGTTVQKPKKAIHERNKCRRNLQRKPKFK